MEMKKDEAIEMVTDAVHELVEKGERHNAPYVALVATLDEIRAIEGNEIDALSDESKFNLALLKTGMYL